jgi:hypothetical protein
MTRLPFTGLVRRANGNNLSCEVTVPKYLIDQGFLKEGEEYEFVVVVK